MLPCLRALGRWLVGNGRIDKSLEKTIWTKNRTYFSLNRIKYQQFCILKPNVGQCVPLHELSGATLHSYQQLRPLRTRTIVSNFDQSHFVLTNPNTAGNWPPDRDHGSPITRESCRRLIAELNQLEIERMEKMRKFNMPELSLGDLVEVKYELSRTQQTFAVFTGYCVDIRNRGLNSSFSLKNAFDGVGVTQLFPLYSPRILNVKVIKSLNRGSSVHGEPITRDYRYRFHYNVRHRFSKKRGVHKPGIRSFEVRLKNRITRLKQNYYKMRLEAGLPPYIWGGPYNINTRKRTRLVKGETYRRIQLYSLDEQRARSEKLSKRRRKHAWGNYTLPGTAYLDSLRGKKGPAED